MNKILRRAVKTSRANAEFYQLKNHQRTKEQNKLNIAKASNDIRENPPKEPKEN